MHCSSFTVDLQNCASDVTIVCRSELWQHKYRNHCHTMYANCSSSMNDGQENIVFKFQHINRIFHFAALTLLSGRQEGHPACKCLLVCLFNGTFSTNRLYCVI